MMLNSVSKSKLVKEPTFRPLKLGRDFELIRRCYSRPGRPPMHFVCNCLISFPARGRTAPAKNLRFPVNPPGERSMLNATFPAEVAIFHPKRPAGGP